jgi:hypothetical protein
MNIDKKKFNRDIIRMTSQGDLTLIEAVVEYCEKHDLEVEVASKLIDKNIKGRIEAEANTLNLLTYKTRYLPI